MSLDKFNRKLQEVDEIIAQLDGSNPNSAMANLNRTVRSAQRSMDRADDFLLSSTADLMITLNQRNLEVEDLSKDLHLAVELLERQNKIIDTKDEQIEHFKRLLATRTAA